MNISVSELKPMETRTWNLMSPYAVIASSNFRVEERVMFSFSHEKG